MTASEEAGGPSGVDGLCPRCNRKPSEGPSGGVTRAWSCVGDQPGSGMESGLGRCLSRGRPGAPAPAGGGGWRGAADKFMGVWGGKAPLDCLHWLGPGTVWTHTEEQNPASCLRIRPEAEPWLSQHWWLTAEPGLGVTWPAGHRDALPTCWVGVAPAACLQPCPWEAEGRCPIGALAREQGSRLVRVPVVKPGSLPLSGQVTDTT